MNRSFKIHPISTEDDMKAVLSDMDKEPTNIDFQTEAKQTLEILKPERCKKYKHYEDEYNRRLLLSGYKPEEKMTLIKETDTLTDVRRTLQETTQVGEEILNNLSTQREKLEKVKKDTKTINADLGVANTFVNRMSRWWRG